MTVLFEADDQHFTWMLGGPAQTAGLRLPPGGVDERSVIEWLQRLAARFRASNRVGVWMIVIDNEVVGLCGPKKAPDTDGTVEIGFGVVSSHRVCDASYRRPDRHCLAGHARPPADGRNGRSEHCFSACA